MVSLVGTFLGRPLLRWRAVIDGCRGFCVARRIGSGWIYRWLLPTHSGLKCPQSCRPKADSPKATPDLPRLGTKIVAFRTTSLASKRPAALQNNSPAIA